MKGGTDMLACYKLVKQNEQTACRRSADLSAAFVVCFPNEGHSRRKGQMWCGKLDRAGDGRVEITQWIR